MKSLGAEAVFDYKSPTAGADIRAYTDNKLKLAWDCTGLGAAVCAGALSSDGGKYANIIGVKKEDLLSVNPKVDGPNFTIMYTIFNEFISKWGADTQPIPEEFEFAVKFTSIVRDLLAEGKLKAPRQFVNRDGEGLEGVLKGLDLLKAGQVSAGKLVYTL